MGFEPTSSLLKRQVHTTNSATRPYLCPRWDSNPQSRTLKGWCFTSSATRAFQKPIRGFNLLPITHRSLCCQPSYLESQRLLFTFVLFHTAKILLLFFILPFLALLVASEGIGPSLVPYDGVLLCDLLYDSHYGNRLLFHRAAITLTRYISWFYTEPFLKILDISLFIVSILLGILHERRCRVFMSYPNKVILVFR